MSVTPNQVIQVIENIADTVETNEQRLNELDSAIGDGDHGVNLKNGFEAVRETLPELGEETDAGKIIQSVGRTIVEETGGSVGILYGSAFKAAGATVEGSEELTLEDMVAMAEAARDAVEERGRVTVGEKTMFDTLHPFAAALRDAYEDGDSTEDALEFALSEAEEGMEETETMVSTKGRAKYFGEDTIGHKDVGAVSTYLILESIIETVTSK